MDHSPRLQDGTCDISALADEIKKCADILAQYARSSGVQLSFAADSEILDIPVAETAACHARSSLFNSMKELQSLIKGPLGIYMDIGAHQVLCLQAVYRFKVAQAIGKDEELTFEELSQRCGLNVQDLRRILRYIMTDFIFQEPRPGIVCHTLASQTLAQDETLREYVGNICEVRFPASARTVDALERFGVSQHPSQSGFSLSRNTDLGLYDELALFPEQASRWNRAMSALTQQIDLEWVLASFLQIQKPSSNFLIVDVGGGYGDISFGLAERLPGATFIVQDFSNTVNTKAQGRRSHLGDRLQFQTYDFRTKQPIAKADVYYFKNIFHNWPDASCVEILRNQIPALKDGATILIDDYTLHEPRTLPWAEERKRRWMDINMLVFFGSRERSLGDWRRLLTNAHPWFHLENVYSAPNQHNTILLIKWKIE